uniref:Uncharacterized protein n=1 Tax=Anguilla anguilla TaxID=7936 RepID=A0A0E9SJL1_ANGAN
MHAKGFTPRELTLAIFAACIVYYRTVAGTS